MSLYSLLECSQNASFSDMKKKYQDLILRHHPDKNGGRESDVFIAVKNAWTILSDSKSRAVYDAELLNMKLEGSQESAIWNTFNIKEMNDFPSSYNITCRCGGMYEIFKEDLIEVKKQEEEEVFVECDTCSLSIIVKFISDG